MTRAISLAFLYLLLIRFLVSSRKRIFPNIALTSLDSSSANFNIYRYHHLNYSLFFLYITLTLVSRFTLVVSTQNHSPFDNLFD